MKAVAVAIKAKRRRATAFFMVVYLFTVAVVIAAALRGGERLCRCDDGLSSNGCDALTWKQWKFYPT